MKHLPLLLVALLLLSSLAPLASAGEAWTKETGSAITAVATDEYGDRIFVGTESGKLYCYDSGGSVVWSVQLGAVGADPSILDIRADTEGHIWVRCGNAFYLRNAETGANIASSEDPTVSAEGGDLSNTGIALNVWDVSFHLKIPSTGHTIYWSMGSYNNGAISGDGTWVVVTKQADPNLYLYSVNLPPDDWIAPYGELGWQNRVSHTIAGSTDGALTNYPVEITVIRGAGSSSGSTLYVPNCREDFADIRFTAADGVTQIPYYLESVVGNTATFLVNVPSIPASPATTTIYVYWANLVVTTTTSDPAAVYAVYDDFNDGVISPQWGTFKDPDGIIQETGGYLELKSPYGTTGNNGAFVFSPTLTGAAHIEVSVKILSTFDSNNNNRHRIFECGGDPGIFDTPGHTVLQRYWGDYSGDAATLDTFVKHDIYITGESTRWIAGSDWDVLSTEYFNSGGRLTFKTGDPGLKNAYGHMQIDYVKMSKWTPNEPTHGAWGPVESIGTPLGTKTLDGTIIDIDAPETGDWIAVSTTTKTYIIEITDSGFGTVYSADRTGTPYAVAIANNGANTIEGRGILADIFRFDGVQAGTYTAGGPVRAVAIAQKNGLYAAAGSDDGKYYIFSKDESSSWYLLHASDSASPVTALAMSWRGEIAIIGRADGSVIAFRLNEEEITGSIRVTVFKDNIPYRDATIYAERSDGNGEFGPPLPYITDSYGAVTIPTNWGNRLRITADDETREIIATPTQLEYVIRIKGPVPLRTGAQYSSTYDDLTQRIYLDYDDTRDKTHHVTYKIIRAADNTEVFNQSYTDADLPLHVYYQIPAGWTNTSYRVHLTASGSPSFTNTWSQWVGTAGTAELPGELDNFARMGIALFLILFLAGLFSYYTGPQGAVVVSLFTGALVLWGWLPLPPAVVALAIIWAFLGLLGRTSGET